MTIQQELEQAQDRRDMARRQWEQAKANRMSRTWQRACEEDLNWWQGRVVALESLAK